VCRVVDGNTDAWLLELQRGTYRRITSAPSLECGGILSPQGDPMVFPSDRNYNLYDLYMVGTNAPGKERLLLESLRNKIPTAWSPDGKFIAYSEQSPETDLDVWAIPVATPSTPIPIAVTRFGESGAEFSPDGHWVAFVSDETGRPEIYVQSFPGPGPKRQISVSGGVAPRWRRHELFFMTVDRAIAAVSIRLLPNDLVVDPPRRLFTIPPTAFYSAFDASPDGARFLVTMGAATTPPVTVVLNWKSPH
jgi:Tol biopolymer transport system component